MLFDDLRKLTTGFIKDWKKGKLKETLKETAEIAMDGKIKVAELEELNGQLQDEIRRLKGEHKKPIIKPANTSDLNPPKKKQHQKKEKNKHIEIDQEISLDIDKDDLPDDAKFIGEREIVIQELLIERKNTKFIIKRYYSVLLGKVIEREIPAAFKGHQFGPTLRTFILYQFYKCRVTHLKIIQMLKDWGINISKGTVCHILNKNQDEFTEDLRSARAAGIKKCSQVHVDDTGAKFNGMKAFTFWS